MGRQGRLVGIVLLGSCALFAAWAQQAGLLAALSAESGAAATHAGLAGPQPSQSQMMSRPTAQQATTARAHSPQRHAPNDIDGDGRSDLLLENRGFNLAAFWIMEGSTPTRYSPAFTPPIDHVQVARGDFNGDGKLDLVWARTAPFTGPVRPPGSPPPTKLVMWLGDGNGFASVDIGDNAEGWVVAGAGDIDGDGKSDLLLINNALAYFAYWKMDGARVASYSPIFARPADSVLATTGDYNGDGRLDLVWENAFPWNWTMWLGDGIGFQSSSLSLNLFFLRGTAAAVMGSGDVDGDGKSDLLSFGVGHFYFHIMNGAQVVRESAAFTPPDSATQPIPGDYNGDGKLDLIWERRSDRSLVFWQGDGNGFSSAAMNGYAPNWQPVNTERQRPFHGDVDGDRRSDLVLIHEEAGLFAHWAMNGARVIRYSPVSAYPDGAQRPLFSADFTIDGLSNLVWFFGIPPGGYLAHYYVAIQEHHRYDRDSLYFYYFEFDRKSVYRAGDDQRDITPLTGTGIKNANGWDRLVAILNGDEVRTSASGRAVQLSAGEVPLADGWNVVGEGDIDGDEREDLILENREGIAYWIIRAGKVARYSPGFLAPAGYQRVAMGDYNGDGKLDIVWARESDRSLLLWQGDGEGFVQAPIGNYAAGWRVFGKDSAINYPPPGGA